MINVFRPFFRSPAEPISVESLTRDVHLKPIHSHNDYWRKRPFIDALLYGCTSVEADIWKFPQTYRVTDTTTGSTAEFTTNEIYVGHNQVHLKPENTLEALYLNPLHNLLESSNKEYTQAVFEPLHKKFGVFFDSPELTLNLWLDLKTNGSKLYEALRQPLYDFANSGYLSYYDNNKAQFVEGPVAITLTGGVPWNLIEREDQIHQQRHVFLDCPLHKLAEASEDDQLKYAKYCLFASASLQQLLGENEYKSSLRQGFTPDQTAKLERAFSAAHALGIKTRVWGGVDWPIHVRDMHWKSLWQLGCDLINADDLKSAAELF